MRTGTWIPALVAAVVLTAVMAWQRETASSCRRRLETLRGAVGELQAVETENRALVASAVSAAQLESLRADHAALVRLRAELDSLRAAARAKTPLAAPVPKPPEVIAPPWRAAGCGTPEDAMRTALSAMGSGELTPFAERITADPTEQAAIDELFSKLPTDVRGKYGTLEAWIAAATARTVLVGSLCIMQQNERGPDEVELTVQLRGQRGTSAAMETRSAQLVLRRAADGWRFMVPLSAVQQFADRETADARARLKS